MIFALDVGTRTVMGLVLEPNKDSLKIKCAVTEEHKGRAMYDGQIQDIPEVVEVVKKVKESIEEKLQKKLDKVSVAAAGRALITVVASKTLKSNLAVSITKDAIHALHLEGLKEAQKKLSTDSESDSYYCVGYSIKNYKLDGVPIKNLEGQFGSLMEVELIATFLPRMVVDSLNTVLNQCGLTVENLTLEPIAASHLVIEPGMRKLNLALVDIGAGTSDIAVSSDGYMIGYGMVPKAGDEITEKISESLLVDFATAEKLKKSLNSEKKIKYVDILGNKQEKSPSEIIELIEDVVKDLAKSISEEIKKLNNNKAPSAVFCIGGASQTPGLAESIAQNLDLIPERVAVKERKTLKNITGCPRNVKGPEAITPLGIAYTQWKGHGISLKFVKVNDKIVRVFSGEKLKVIDALYEAGIPGSAIYGKPGKGMTVEVSGEIVLIPGKPAKSAKIKVNSKEASLDTYLNSGDKIEFIEAKEGEPARVRLNSVLPDDLYKEITVNSEIIKIEPKVFLNGEVANLSTYLKDNDKVSWEKISTLRDVLKYCKYDLKKIKKVLLNGKEASLDTEISNGDEIFIPKETSNNNSNNINKKITVKVNDSLVELPEGSILTDIFSVYDFPITPPTGKNNLVMNVNGSEGTFVTPLKTGDIVKISWE